MLVLLARHPEIKKHRESEFVGQRDLPLSSVGKKEAKKLSRFLHENYSVERLFSSPLKRCLKTAEEIASSFKLTVFKEERLKEMNFGNWEGKTVEEIFGENPKANLFYPPQGETIENFCRRVGDFFSERIAARGKGTVLVVSHAGVLKAILLRVKGLPLDQFWEIPQDYAALTEIYHSDGKEFQIGRFNDRTYLEEA